MGEVGNELRRPRITKIIMKLVGYPPGSYTEIPNRYPIFSNTDTDTDVGILNTENSVRYSGAVRCVTFETGQLKLSYWPLYV